MIKNKVGDDDFPVDMMPEWRQFFQRDTNKPGLDFYDDIFASRHLFPLQRKRELARMMRIARTTNPKTVMEIGADKGGGLYHWCMSLPTVKNVIGCEIRGTPYAELFEKRFPGIRFGWLSASLPLQKWFIGWCMPIDCLFIDGDKCGFLKDFDAYLPLMSPTGVVFMHDIQDSPGPKDAWEIVKQRGYRTEEIIDTSEYDPNSTPLTPHDHWLHFWRGRSCGVGVVYLEGK